MLEQFYCDDTLFYIFKYRKASIGFLPTDALPFYDEIAFLLHCGILKVLLNLIEQRKESR